jgi:hypothetical protein
MKQMEDIFIRFMSSGVDVMIPIFCNFSTIFGEKIVIFLKNQYYDQIFAKTSIT